MDFMRNSTGNVLLLRVNSAKLQGGGEYWDLARQSRSEAPDRA